MQFVSVLDSIGESVPMFILVIPIHFNRLSLFMSSKSVLYCFAIIKLLISNVSHKLRSLFIPKLRYYTQEIPHMCNFIFLFKNHKTTPQ